MDIVSSLKFVISKSLVCDFHYYIYVYSILILIKHFPLNNYTERNSQFKYLS